MAFTPFTKAAQASVNMLLNNEPAQNTLWFESSVTPTTESCQQLAQDLMDYWIATMIPILSQDVTLFSVEVVSQVTNPGPYGIAAPGSTTVGLVTSGTAPNNVTLSVSFRTGLTGRSNRGRNYWVGIPGTVIATNFIDGGYLSSISDAYFGMVGAEAVSAGWTWGVGSRFHNGARRVLGVFTPITSVVIVDNVADSSRRRLPGRGE